MSVHRTDCENILKMPEWDRERLIEAEWNQGAEAEATSEKKYMAELIIHGYNRTGLLVDISKVFTEREIDIITMNSRITGKALQRLHFHSEQEERTSWPD